MAPCITSDTGPGAGITTCFNRVDSFYWGIEETVVNATKKWANDLNNEFIWSEKYYDIESFVPGKRWHEAWGEEPMIQTADIRPMPCGFGQGSSTLYSWINNNLD